MSLFDFAFIDGNNKVVNVVVFDSENPDTELLNSFKELFGAVDYKSCSVYGKAPMNGLFIGDRFVAEQPYPSWILDTETFEWVSPVGEPVAPLTRWDEASLSWQPMTPID